MDRPPAGVKTVNVAEKLSQFNEHWRPRVIGELNGQHVRVAKLLGEFVWHRHENEDELIMVLEGELVIQLRDGERRLGPGEFVVLPRGVEHRPVADREVHVLMFEPASTLNTGDQRNERTVEAPEHI